MSLYDNNNVTLQGRDGTYTTLSTQEQRRQHPETLYSRSQAPSKHELRAESHKMGRKQYNWRKQNGLNSPVPRSVPKNQTPKPAGGIAPSPSQADSKTHKRRSSSPFDMDSIHPAFRW